MHNCVYDLNVSLPDKRLVYFPSYIFYFGLIIICESAQIKAVRGPKAEKQFLPTYHNFNRRTKGRSFTSQQPISAGN
jgi:hypothetical protein